MSPNFCEQYISLHTVSSSIEATLSATYPATSNVILTANVLIQTQSWIGRYKRIVYSLSVIQQYLVINSITVNRFAAPFKCTPVDLNVLNHFRSGGRGWVPVLPVEAPSNFKLLIVPRRYFGCGSLCSVSVLFHLLCV